MKLIFFILAMIFLSQVLLGLLTGEIDFESKRIELPKEAHDTIGEIPIIEHFDDGALNKSSGKYFHIPYHGFSHSMFFYPQNDKWVVTSPFGPVAIVSQEEFEKCRVDGVDGKSVSCEEFSYMSTEERMERLWRY